MFELQNGNKQMIIWICENTQNNEYFRENKLTILIYISLQSILAEFVKRSSSTGSHNVCKVCNR